MRPLAMLIRSEHFQIWLHELRSPWGSRQAAQAGAIAIHLASMNSASKVEASQQRSISIPRRSAKLVGEADPQQSKPAGPNCLLTSLEREKELSIQERSRLLSGFALKGLFGVTL